MTHFRIVTLLLASLFLLAGCAPETAPPTTAKPTSPPRPQFGTVEGDLTKEGPTDPDAPKEFTTTDSGLKYRVLRKTKGESPNEHSSVVVSYRGWLDNGHEFDSSYTSGRPLVTLADAVIKGWTEVLLIMHEGEKIEVEIPSNLGYGARGHGAIIPPGSTLHFIIELHSFK